MNKTNIVFGIGIVLAVLAMLTAPAAADGVVYFQPDPSTVSLAPGENVTIQIMADVDATESGLISLQVGVDFDPSVVNITDVTNPWVIEPWVTWWMQSFLWDNPSDEDPGPLGAWVWITAAHNSCYDAPVTEVQVANLTIEGVSGGTSPLNFTGEIRLEPTRGMSWLFDCTGSPVLPTTWNNGTIECAGQTYTINGTVPGVDTVNITNLNTSEDYTADVVGDDYTLTLDVLDEVEAGNKLLIVACEDLGDYESNCNVTTHTVVTAPGEETVDLTLNHYCLNWKTYPYKKWEQTNWSGPAVMQMMVDHYRPLEPTQSDLNATGIAHNQDPPNADLLQVDPAGMKWTLNDILHNTSSYGGGPYANYGIGSYDNVEGALHYICYWQYAGPGSAPAYGNYSNWMAIRGIHTNVSPKWQAQGSYDIYGFWINDPYNESIEGPGGIGENTYKTVDQWVGQYHESLTDVRDGDSYQNRYVAVCEPPTQPDAEVTLVPSPPRFNSTDPVKAAIDGANEQLAPYDAEFAAIFADTVATEPLYVTSDAGDDYYLVPFSSTGSTSDVIVVVIVDGEDGHFKEASWVEEQMKYLPVSEQDAIEIVGEPGATAELVHQGSSPYYPDWNVTVGSEVYFVSQDARLSYGDSVDFQQNVLLAQRALGKPNDEGALMRRNSRIAIELEETIPECTKVSVWVRKVAVRAPSFEVAVSSDGENWTSIGNATCDSWQWQRFDFTGNWDDVKYIGIRKPGTLIRPKLMGLDAVRAVGRCC